jgi:hypothetical protein
MPVDVVKTRLQFDGATGSAARYSGALNCATTLVRTEGPQALFKGLPPALLRQSTYGSMRYGLYGPIKSLLDSDSAEGKSSTALWKKVVAGAAAGAVASAAANPTDLVKVRMQTDGMAHGEKRYTGVRNCFFTIVREEGIFGLWKGVGPTMGRATVLAAAELSTYDEVKCQITRHRIIEQEGLLLHVTTAFISGFASTVVSSPFDVVKSRVMAQPLDSNGVGKLYSGMIDCFVKSIRQQGALSLYSGFWPNFGRVGPRVTIVFIVMEQLKSRLG